MYSPYVAATTAMLDVIPRILAHKVVRRLQTAATTGEATKVVLFQYFYTRKGETPNLVTRLPSGMLMHDAFFKLDLAKHILEIFNPGKIYGDKITVYRRHRVNYSNGTATRDTKVYQVVLSIAEGALLPPAAPAAPANSPLNTAMEVESTLTVNTDREHVVVDVNEWTADFAQDYRGVLYAEYRNAKKLVRVKTCSPNNPTRNSVPLQAPGENDATVGFYENIGEEPLVLVENGRLVLELGPGLTGLVSFEDGQWA